jgi:hypothetical protein
MSATSRHQGDVDFRGDLYSLDRAAFVTLAGTSPVRVRFRFDDGGIPWRCDACGRFRLPSCPHSQRVADALIRQLLDDTEPEGNST